MTEKEAIEQSLQHWRDNLEKAKALSIKEIVERLPEHEKPHAIARGVFGIDIDSEHCALCQYHTEGCGGCVLCDYERSGSVCCLEWKKVYYCLLAMRHNLTAKWLLVLVDAISDMVARLEYELEEYDDRTSDTTSVEED